MRGTKHIAQAVEKGEDPNADLTEHTPASRAEAALTLRIAGASYTRIAQTLEYANHYDARKAVERVLSEAARSEDAIEHQRTLHSRRLDRLLHSVMPTAVNTKSPDHLAYNARALAILDRIAALGGLNAPTQQVVYTPRAEEIEKYVAKFATLAQADNAATEADVIEIEAE